MNMNITFNGNTLTLMGDQVKVGDIAPDFNLTNRDLNVVSLKDLKKGKKIFVVVPSLDTGVCDIESKKFNEKASSINANVYIISLDLPFAQLRWSEAACANNVTVLSDYRDRSFAMNYGTFIKELAILTRAVFVLDENDKVVYVEYVSEITNEPNYEAILNIVK